MNTEDFIRALRQVPEVHLRLTDLAWELTKSDGSLDYERMAFLAKELEQATDEARAYTRATNDAVWALKQMAHS